MQRIIKYIIVFGVINLVFGVLYASNRDLPGIDIISRAERGVDESLRLKSYEKFQNILKYRENYKKEMEELKRIDYDAYYQKSKSDQEESYKSQMANDYLKQYYGDEIDLDRTNYEYKGEDIWRPEYHKNDKSKIIVHHTASDNSDLKNKSDVKEYLSGVFLYHTIKHGWGDIGYNFIIDPFGNIYEGRAGGEGVVGAHAKWNNTPSLGISLIGNFEEQIPTKKAVSSLINLSTALSQKYNMNPKSTVSYHRDIDDAPYIESNHEYALAGHKDAGYTACPGKNLYTLLSYIRDKVSKNLESYTLTSADDIKDLESKPKKKNTKLTYEYFNSIEKKIRPVFNGIKNKYIKEHNIKSSTSLQTKNIGYIDKNQAKIYLKEDINVLLYQLTQDYNQYDIVCSNGCVFVFNKNRVESNKAKLIVRDSIKLELDNKEYKTDRVVIYSNDDIIEVENYDRKSYSGIPRNTFHGSLIFKKDDMKDLNGQESNKFVVINKLPISEYLKGIVETNDTESLTKNKVMSLVAKSYALFYMSYKNTHPNIPKTATYNAVDDPRIFQKYVGAGLENTLDKRYKALESTKDKILLYKDKVIILPYFSCSAGFTYSAKEKRGREDTPYLKSKFDIGICSDKEFNGHGVGLSGLGAERWSNFGRSYQDILKYYYPGIQIESI